MKKTLLSLLLITLIGTPIIANAEVLNPNEQPKNAIINEIVSTDTYSFEIKWESLKYYYVKISDGNYRWMPDTQYGNYEHVDYTDSCDNEFDRWSYLVANDNNYIDVKNTSTLPITASLAWTPSITGVTASYRGMITDDTYSCMLDRSTGSSMAWNKHSLEYKYSSFNTGVYYSSSYNNDPKYYTDSSCTTEVSEGTLYTPNTYYTYALNTVANNNPTAILDVPTYVNSELTQYKKIRWYIDLTGGSLTDVESANATEGKVIGSLALTLTDVE